MGNFIYYEKLEDYKIQVKKAKEYDNLQQEKRQLKEIIEEVRELIFKECVLTKYENALLELPASKVWEVLQILDKVSE